MYGQRSFRIPGRSLDVSSSLATKMSSITGYCSSPSFFTRWGLGQSPMLPVFSSFINKSYTCIAPQLTVISSLLSRLCISKTLQNRDSSLCLNTHMWQGVSSVMTVEQEVENKPCGGQLLYKPRLQSFHVVICTRPCAHTHATCEN